MSLQEFLTYSDRCLNWKTKRPRLCFSLQRIPAGKSRQHILFSTADFITTQEEFDHSSSSTLCPRLCPTGNPTGGKGEKRARRKTHLPHIWLHFPRRKVIWKSSSSTSIISQICLKISSLDSHRNFQHCSMSSQLINILSGNLKPLFQLLSTPGSGSQNSCK